MAEKSEKQLQSVEYPMPSLVNADRVIDELYGNNPNRKIPLDQICEAEAKASVAPDVITYFRHIPNTSYTKSELRDALNHLVKERGREKEVGLFGVGRAEHEAQQERHQKQV
ncbi:MAG TPA: hypothetical protein VNL16_15450 [Chloroflexota bacterium]|nr:hypothetical protein [Chloroflexota bacterium]